METKDLILRKPVFEDWPHLYRNVWSRAETAKYMLWNLTTSEEEARARMERTIAFQSENHAWIVCERKSGIPIGFCGMLPAGMGTYEDCGIAVGPEFTGRGYGKQILQAITGFAFEQLGAKRFVCACRSQNGPSRGMILSCGFRFTHNENRLDPRNGQAYVLEFYEKERDD